ncbi:hypothetical protein [Mesorhizobium sp. YM1C-6-2]|uniref:hypothetical protein n=1 Tax=Mesorhizobium sp. YM1C-6-2 TaxID=1827501 RepID=UPI000EF24C5A|nr:hypothetical protein [Mesorhizobium sp. YM1C-6-2]RLP28385.1 hypothetical protein D8676_04405 [Mesorhizobium sp. YM1C-6-2]
MQPAGSQDIEALGRGFGGYDLIQIRHPEQAAPPRSRQREESDDYPTVVANINAVCRIIEGRDGIQWILQRLAGKRHGQPRWEGKRYCQTRQVRLRSVHDLCGSVDATALAILESLPDWIEGGVA